MRMSLRVSTVMVYGDPVESVRMPALHGWVGRGVAIAAVLILAVAAGLLAGLGTWFFAGLTGVLIGAAAALVALAVARTSPAAVLGRLRRVDPISGLPGTERLRADLERELGRDGFGAALYLCSLHGMGAYNDAYGEACGDAMIGWLARRLREAIGERGSVYRLRGATFAVLAGLGERIDDLQGVAASALLEVGEGFMIRAAIARALLPDEADSAVAGIELATRRALAERRARPGDSELRPPEDPMEVIPLQRPRYQVADVAARIGRRLGMDATELEQLEAAAHLRDVGNMALPSAVLAREGELPEHEWKFVRLHTVVGERLLAGNFGMEAVARIVRSSHERWDGGATPTVCTGPRSRWPPASCSSARPSRT